MTPEQLSVLCLISENIEKLVARTPCLPASATPTSASEASLYSQLLLTSGALNAMTKRTNTQIDELRAQLRICDMAIDNLRKQNENLRLEKSSLQAAFARANQELINLIYRSTR